MHQERYITNGVSDKDTTDVLQVLSDSFSALYLLLTKFVQIALALPVSNADSERGFSRMIRVKTTLRNCLTVSSLDTLLRISMKGPEHTKFDFSRAVSMRASSRNRRIF